MFDYNNNQAHYIQAKKRDNAESNLSFYVHKYHEK